MIDQSHRLLERLQTAMNSFSRQNCEWRNVHEIICILRGYLIATTNEIIIREVYNLLQEPKLWKFGNLFFRENRSNRENETNVKFMAWLVWLILI